MEAGLKLFVRAFFMEDVPGNRVSYDNLPPHLSRVIYRAAGTVLPRPVVNGQKNPRLFHQTAVALHHTAVILPHISPPHPHSIICIIHD